MSERCVRTVHANGDWGDYRCELDDGHGGSHAIGIRSLLVDRKALVRYARDVWWKGETDGTAYEALSQELKDEIERVEDGG